jgi:hypothetical protein
MKASLDENVNIECYKRIDAEEYRILDNRNNKNVEFDRFPCDGLWLVSSEKNCRTTSFIYDIKKMDNLPPKYPLIELALRKDDISRSILRFLEQKEKSLMELGSCTYSVHELTEFIVSHIVNQEFGGGSKKVLVEKNYIKIENK